MHIITSFFYAALSIKIPPSIAEQHHHQSLHHVTGYRTIPLFFFFSIRASRFLELRNVIDAPDNPIAFLFFSFIYSPLHLSFKFQQILRTKNKTV